MLTKSTTNVTEKRIAELREKNKDLPQEFSDENLVIWKERRKEIRDIRGLGKTYVEDLKRDIKAMGKIVEQDWAKLLPILEGIEAKSDKLIKDHEKVVKEKAAEKKRKKAEIAEAMKKIDDEIIVLANIPVKFIKAKAEAIKEEVARLEGLEFSEEDYGDRADEAELKRELSIENLQELLDAAVEKEAAAKKAAEEKQKAKAARTQYARRSTQYE